MKKIILFISTLFLFACSSGTGTSMEGGSSSSSSGGGSSASIDSGYYTGTIIYPDNSVHNVFGAFDGLHIFLLKDANNPVGYRIFAGNTGDLGGFGIYPSTSVLYMKHVFDSDFQSEQSQPVINAFLNTSSEPGSDLITNFSETINGTNVQYSFTITDPNAQFNGNYIIALSQSSDPNNAIAVTNSAAFIGTAWNTTDSVTSLSLNLNGFSNCEDPTSSATCTSIFGQESGGNGNSSELDDNGNYCSILLGQIEAQASSTFATFFSEEQCDSTIYTFGLDDEPSIAWISTISGVQTLHTLSFLSYRDITYDAWQADGVTTYTPPG